MRYLLIDFGATYIKCVVYNKATGEVVDARQFESPFKVNNTTTSKALLKLLSDTILAYDRVDGVVICTILGGRWQEDAYLSWKDTTDKGESCLISGLFNSVVHEDHKPFTTAKSYVTGLVTIGILHQTPVYCSLGDTDCVIRSLRLEDGEVAINMGTGSQVITKDNIKRYYPAGRSFLAYQELFNSIGLDMFQLIDQLTAVDVLKSPLEVDLAVFRRARGYTNGGSITQIDEGNFTVHNMLGALLRSFVLQYKEAIGDAKTIILVGGIAKKVKLLPSLFQYYYPQAEVSLAEGGVESTHKGMINYINEQL
jgi:hypothetical protein